MKKVPKNFLATLTAIWNLKYSTAVFRVIFLPQTFFAVLAFLSCHDCPLKVSPTFPELLIRFGPTAVADLEVN